MNQPVSPSPAPNGHPTPFRRDVQGLRAVAVLMVILFHAGLPLPGGFIGVDVFFVISGFVITSMLSRQYETYGRVSFTKFYVRRFKRLTPALAAMLAVTLILAIPLSSPLGTQQEAALTALGALLLVANVVIQATTGGYFDAAAEFNPLLNTWSLSVEEQFYLIFPALMAIGWAVGSRLRRRNCIVLILLVTATAVSFSLALLPKEIPGGPSWTIPLLGFYSPVVRVWEFTAGALLFYLGTRVHLGTAASTLLSLAGGLTVGLGVVLITPATTFPSAWTLLPVLGTAGLILGGYRASAPVTRLLSTPPMLWIGDRSYSLYLWHWPMIVFAALLAPEWPPILIVGALVSLLPALVSYRYVEERFRYAPLSNLQLVKLTVATLLIVVVPASLLYAGSSLNWVNTNIQSAREQINESHAAEVAGCHVYSPLPINRYHECWLGAGRGDPIYLVGDSNADQFSEAVLQAGDDLDRPVSITTASACAFITQEVTGDTSSESRCQLYNQRTMEWLGATDPGTVIIANLGGPGLEGGGDVFRSLLATTINQLKSQGHEVAVVQSIPTIETLTNQGMPWNPRVCSAVRLFQGSCLVETNSSHSAAKKVLLRRLTSSVAETLGAGVIDVSMELCPDELCQTYRDGIWVYRDSNHITAAQSRLLGETFLTALLAEQRSPHP